MKKWFQRLKSKIDKRLEKLAEENRRIYGNQRLDCCNINRVNQKPTVKRESSKVAR